MEQVPWNVESFSERMQRGRDEAALRLHASDCTLPTRIERRLMRRTVDVINCAALLKVSAQRVRKLLSQKRVRGARRIKGEWRIPIGETGLPTVLVGRRGPNLRVIDAEFDDIPI